MIQYASCYHFSEFDEKLIGEYHNHSLSKRTPRTFAAMTPVPAVYVCFPARSALQMIESAGPEILDKRSRQILAGPGMSI